jgi:hypothetical protein
MARALTLLIVLALTGCGASSTRCASKDAQGIVRALQPQEQFRAMLEATTQRTQTMIMALAQGGPGTKRELARAVDAAVARHGEEWKQNLVSSWSTLSPAELEQVCTALNERDQASFMRFAERLGRDVQSRNEPLLKQAAAEVLEAVRPSAR